jgi:hypothetical protein
MLKDKLLLENEMIKKEKVNIIINGILEEGGAWGFKETLWWFDDNDKDFKFSPALETFMDGLHKVFLYFICKSFEGEKEKLITVIEDMYREAVSNYNKNNNMENSLNLLRMQLLSYLITNSNLHLCMKKKEPEDDKYKKKLSKSKSQKKREKKKRNKWKKPPSPSLDYKTYDWNVPATPPPLYV